MSHLVQESMPGIENNLIWVKSVRDSIFAWWFNLTALFVVLGSFGYFVYSGYGIEEEKKIPFEPRIWNNAVRNVPTSNYGQTPQIETGIGIQGYVDRTSASAF